MSRSEKFHMNGLLVQKNREDTLLSTTMIQKRAIKFNFLNKALLNTSNEKLFKGVFRAIRLKSPHTFLENAKLPQQNLFYNNNNLFCISNGDYNVHSDCDASFSF